MFHYVICLLLCAWFLQTLTSAAHGATESGWIIQQRSKVSGQHTIYLSPTRLKSVNNLSKITMITSAPKWKIVVMNDLSKKFYTTNINQLTGAPSGRVFTGHRLDMTQGMWMSKPGGTMFGQKTVAHDLYRKPPNLGPQKRASVFEIDHVSGVTRATSACMAAAPMPDVMSNLVSRMYSVAPLKEFPLRVFYCDAQGIEVASLLTTSLKAAKITDDQFVVPRGYKQAKTEEEVYQDETSKKAMQDSFGWLGEVDKSPSPAKH